MSARLDRLEELLARVRTNADKPRLALQGTQSVASPAAPPVAVASSVAAAPPVAAIEPLELDEPGVGSIAPPPPSSGITSELDAPLGSAAETPIEDLDDLEGIEEIEGEEVELEEPAAQAELDEEEPAPISHSSPVASSTLEDAIETAAHEPPLTPPPESGAESIDGPQFPPREGPTMEQLGETIALEEGPSQDFELDAPLAEQEQEAVSSAENPWEARLPAAAETAELVAPPGAREELERLRLGESVVVEATVARRPSISTNVVELVEAQRGSEPLSFVELLDASLGL